VQCKQERNEFLRSYTRCFFDVRATIANISEEDIIDCFYNGITDPGIYRDFGRNRPKTVAGLRDMMHDWSEQEEKMRERFPRCQDSNLRCSNDNRNDKGQRDYLGPPQKRRPDDLIAAVDRPSRGKKSMTQEEFEKLLQKKCPAPRCQSRSHRLLPPSEDIQQLWWWQEEQEACRQGT
jgi:hypothetical protein